MRSAWEAPHRCSWLRVVSAGTLVPGSLAQIGPNRPKRVSIESGKVRIFVRFGGLPSLDRGLILGSC